MVGADGRNNNKNINIVPLRVVYIDHLITDIWVTFILKNQQNSIFKIRWFFQEYQICFSYLICLYPIYNQFTASLFILYHQTLIEKLIVFKILLLNCLLWSNFKSFLVSQLHNAISLSLREWSYISKTISKNIIKEKNHFENAACCIHQSIGQR